MNDLELRWMLDGLFELVRHKLSQIEVGMDESEADSLKDSIDEMLNDFIKGEFRGTWLDTFKWDVDKMLCPDCQVNWDDWNQENPTHITVTHLMPFRGMEVIVYKCECGLFFYWDEGALDFFRLPSNVWEYMGEYDSFKDILEESEED